MSVQAIYACKLYKASTRKDKIKAGVENPINSELVMQLDEYLDDEYQEQVKVKPSESDVDDVSKDESNEKDEKIRPSESHGGGGGGFSGPSFSDSGSSLSEGAAKVDEERAEALDFGSESDSNDDADVAESTKVSKKAIKASMETDIAVESDAIIGLLNSREDTAGVCRCLVKDSELWVHYNDSINLNNVMEPVIALLNASSYTMLDFNRLARTENAIVFSISESLKPVEPMESVDGEK